MQNKKLLSVRLDPTTLANIEKFVANRIYWKRNTVISNVLDAVFDNFDEKAIYDMVRYCRFAHKNAFGSFSLDKLTQSNPGEADSSK